MTLKQQIAKICDDPLLSPDKMAEVICDLFVKRVSKRIINKDNPQYALGWNACREVISKGG